MAGEYRVTWMIDVIADSPREAAECAPRIQRDRESTAVVFEAKAAGEKAETIYIDLQGQGDIAPAME